MGYAGIKRDRPSLLTQAISTAYPPLGNNFHQHPPLSREHKGRGEESNSIAAVMPPATAKTRFLTCNHLVAYHVCPWMRPSKRWPMLRAGRCWTGFTPKTVRP